MIVHVYRNSYLKDQWYQRSTWRCKEPVRIFNTNFFFLDRFNTMLHEYSCKIILYTINVTVIDFDTEIYFAFNTLPFLFMVQLLHVVLLMLNFELCIPNKALIINHNSWWICKLCVKALSVISYKLLYRMYSFTENYM